MASIRLFLSMAALKHWPLYQLDITNGVLCGDLEEEIYMKQPPIILLLRESQVWFTSCQVFIWVEIVSLCLEDLARSSSNLGLTRCEVDHSIFIKCSHTHSNIFILCCMLTILLFTEMNM